jgi:hypothetical protein
MEDPGWDGEVSDDGARIPRFQWVDQYGEEVDIYDFANSDKLVIVDLSGEWCSWCNELAKWLEGQSSAFDGYWPEIKEGVENGDVYWITLLDADWGGRKISDEELVEWFDIYPNENIPVLADKDQEMMAWMEVVGYPTVVALNPDLSVGKFNSRGDYTKVLDWVVEQL